MPVGLFVIVPSAFSQCVFHGHSINIYDEVNILRIFTILLAMQYNILFTFSYIYVFIH